MYVQMVMDVLGSRQVHQEIKGAKMKDEVFQLRISEVDRKRMQMLAQRNGVSMAGVIRMLLRQAVSDEELRGLPPQESEEREDEEDAALGRHASKIYDSMRSGKEAPVSLAEVKAELVAAGVLDA